MTKLRRVRNGLYNIGYYDIVRNDYSDLWSVYSHKERRTIHIDLTLRNCKKWISKNIDALDLR